MTVNNSSLAIWAATIEAVIFASEKPIRESDLRNHLPDDMEPVSYTHLTLPTKA